MPKTNEEKAEYMRRRRASQTEEEKEAIRARARQNYKNKHHPIVEEPVEEEEEEPPRYAIDDEMLATAISHLRHPVLERAISDVIESVAPASTIVEEPPIVEEVKRRILPFAYSESIVPSLVINERATQTEIKGGGLSLDKIEERKKNADAIRRWRAKKLAENPIEFRRRQRYQKRDYRAYKKEQESKVMSNE